MQKNYLYWLLSDRIATGNWFVIQYLLGTHCNAFNNITYSSQKFAVVMRSTCSWFLTPARTGRFCNAWVADFARRRNSANFHQICSCDSLSCLTRRELSDVVGIFHSVTWMGENGANNVLMVILSYIRVSLHKGRLAYQKYTVIVHSRSRDVAENIWGCYGNRQMTQWRLKPKGIVIHIA